MPDSLLSYPHNTICPNWSRLVSGHAICEVDALLIRAYTHTHRPSRTHINGKSTELKPKGDGGQRRQGSKVMAGRALSYSNMVHVTGRATLDINVSIIMIR